MEEKRARVGVVNSLLCVLRAQAARSRTLANQVAALYLVNLKELHRKLLLSADKIISAHRAFNSRAMSFAKVR